MKSKYKNYIIEWQKTFNEMSEQLKNMSVLVLTSLYLFSFFR